MVCVSWEGGRCQGVRELQRDRKQHTRGASPRPKTALAATHLGKLIYGTVFWDRPRGGMSIRPVGLTMCHGARLCLRDRVSREALELLV